MSFVSFFFTLRLKKILPCFLSEYLAKNLIFVLLFHQIFLSSFFLLLLRWIFYSLSLLREPIFLYFESLFSIFYFLSNSYLYPCTLLQNFFFVFPFSTEKTRCCLFFLLDTFYTFIFQRFVFSVAWKDGFSCFENSSFWFSLSFFSFFTMFLLLHFPFFEVSLKEIVFQQIGGTSSFFLTFCLQEEKLCV